MYFLMNNEWMMVDWLEEWRIPTFSELTMHCQRSGMKYFLLDSKELQLVSKV
jgi:hypothetical protein